MSVKYRGKTYYHFIDGGRYSTDQLRQLTQWNHEDLEFKELGTGPAIDRINAEIREIHNSFVSYKIKKLTVNSVGGV